MDNLAPVLSGLKTYAVPLVQRARQSLEPAFKALHIPNNPYLRSYLTAVVFVGVITGVGLVIGRSINYDKTRLSDYGIKAKLKDFAACTILPGVGWVWRKLYGHPYKSADESSIVKAAIIALTGPTDKTKTAEEKETEAKAAWKNLLGQSVNATAEQIKAVKATLKGNRTNYDHLPVEVIARFFPETLKEWIESTADNIIFDDENGTKPFKWSNLGDFTDNHLTLIYDGFAAAAKADAEIVNTDVQKIKATDPRRLAAKERLDDLALQLKAIVQATGRGLQDLEFGDDSKHPLATAVRVLGERHIQDGKDFAKNGTADESKRVFKEWETVGDLRTLSPAQLKDAKDKQGETFLRLIAAKGHASFVAR